MKKHLPLITMLTGFISFIGIIYMMMNPDISNALIFCIYLLAASSGIMGLSLMGKKK